MNNITKKHPLNLYDTKLELSVGIIVLAAIAIFLYSIGHLEFLTALILYPIALSCFNSNKLYLKIIGIIICPIILVCYLLIPKSTKAMIKNASNNERQKQAEKLKS